MLATPPYSLIPPRGISQRDRNNTLREKCQSNLPQSADYTVASVMLFGREKLRLWFICRKLKKGRTFVHDEQKVDDFQVVTEVMYKIERTITEPLGHREKVREVSPKIVNRPTQVESNEVRARVLRRYKLDRNNSLGSILWNYAFLNPLPEFFFS
ncbi:hypothetical protein J6590_097567 [Homalodisca vitripennis]|nr:hypothetical protein J6590_097567 [Homalodisca vitripennis]